MENKKLTLPEKKEIFATLFKRRVYDESIETRLWLELCNIIPKLNNREKELVYQSGILGIIIKKIPQIFDEVQKKFQLITLENNSDITLKEEVESLLQYFGAGGKKNKGNQIPDIEDENSKILQIDDIKGSNPGKITQEDIKAFFIKLATKADQNKEYETTIISSDLQAIRTTILLNFVVPVSQDNYDALKDAKTFLKKNLNQIPSHFNKLFTLLDNKNLPIELDNKVDKNWNNKFNLLKVWREFYNCKDLTLDEKKKILTDDLDSLNDLICHIPNNFNEVVSLFENDLDGQIKILNILNNLDDAAFKKLGKEAEEVIGKKLIEALSKKVSKK